MVFLLGASLLWAFSFGLIKGQLAGVDPVLVSLVRLALAAAAFAPFFRPGPGLDRRLCLKCLGLGALQFGLMYILYISAYRYLAAWMVALFTIFTPLYVVLLAAGLARSFSWKYLLAALLAIAGAALVVARQAPDRQVWQGILLLQGANLCFALGQLLYGRIKERGKLPDRQMLAWMYAGALLVPVGWLLVQPVETGAGLGLQHVPTLLYLGLVPTALGFYLWNRGAARVQAGQLAVANNLKVPLAVLVAWLVFGESADYLRVLAGMGLVVAGLFLATAGQVRRYPG